MTRVLKGPASRRKRDGIERVKVTAMIPATTWARACLILRGPHVGEIPWGAKSDLIAELLADWAATHTPGGDV